METIFLLAARVLFGVPVIAITALVRVERLRKLLDDQYAENLCTVSDLKQEISDVRRSFAALLQRGKSAGCLLFRRANCRGTCAKFCTGAGCACDHTIYAGIVHTRTFPTGNRHGAARTAARRSSATTSSFSAPRSTHHD